MQFVSIFGPPGAGKTSVAVPLAAKMKAGYISSGDIARKVDPESLALGKMADRATLRAGFIDAILDAAAAGYRTCIVDGLPRDPTDCELLPDDALYVLLTAKPSVLARRQLDRGRPGDEPEIITARTTEQLRLMQLSVSDGWAYRIAGPAVVDTTKLTRMQTAEAVQRRLLDMGVLIDR